MLKPYVLDICRASTAERDNGNTALASGPATNILYFRKFFCLYLCYITPVFVMQPPIFVIFASNFPSYL